MGDDQCPTEGDSRLRGTREPVHQATDSTDSIVLSLVHRPGRCCRMVTGRAEAPGDSVADRRPVGGGEM